MRIMADITAKVTTIMHDTSDLDQAVTFWTELLGLSVVHRENTYAYLSPLSEGGPHLAFQEVPESRAAKNRLHLDIGVPDRMAFEDQVASLGGGTSRRAALSVLGFIRRRLLLQHGRRSIADCPQESFG